MEQTRDDEAPKSSNEPFFTPRAIGVRGVNSVLFLFEKPTPKPSSTLSSNVIS